MSDDALDLEGIPRHALCDDLLCQFEQECVSLFCTRLSLQLLLAFANATALTTIDASPRIEAD